MQTELPEDVGMTSKITSMDKSQQKHDGCAFHFEHKYSIFTSVRLVRWEKTMVKRRNHLQFWFILNEITCNLMKHWKRQI